MRRFGLGFLLALVMWPASHFAAAQGIWQRNEPAVVQQEQRQQQEAARLTQILPGFKLVEIKDTTSYDEEMIAAKVQVPADWTTTGTIGVGMLRNNIVIISTFRAESPDGKQTLEYVPNLCTGYARNVPGYNPQSEGCQRIKIEGNQDFASYMAARMEGAELVRVRSNPEAQAALAGQGQIFAGDPMMRITPVFFEADYTVEVNGTPYKSVMQGVFTTVYTKAGHSMQGYGFQVPIAETWNADTLYLLAYSAEADVYNELPYQVAQASFAYEEEWLKRFADERGKMTQANAETQTKMFELTQRTNAEIFKMQQDTERMRSESQQKAADKFRQVIQGAN